MIGSPCVFVFVMFRFVVKLTLDAYMYAVLATDPPFVEFTNITGLSSAFGLSYVIYDVDESKMMFCVYFIVEPVAVVKVPAARTFGKSVAPIVVLAEFILSKIYSGFVDVANSPLPTAVVVPVSVFSSPTKPANQVPRFVAAITSAA